MNTESKIFFSYSRDNSPFVINLAKKLKAEGYDVWLDQLDIPVGARWDMEIEKALSKANTLIVVMSKNSMDSQNVLDEVSYAMDENKKVIPLLHEDCEIPFRLRRLQYVDYTKSNNIGYDILKRALDGEMKSAAQPQNVEKVSNPVSTPKPPKATHNNPPKQVVKKNVTTRPTAPAVQKSSGIGKTILYIAIPLVLLVGGWFAMKNMSGDSTTSIGSTKSADVTFWEEHVLPLKSLESYKLYLDKYPNGTYAKAAQENIDKLSSNQEEELWKQVMEGKSEELYTQYIGAYPNGKYINEARKNYDDVRAWNASQKANSTNGYLNYIVEYGKKGLFADKAINLIKDTEDHLTAWLYAARVNDDKMSDAHFEVVCCLSEGENELDSSRIPQKGDIVKKKGEARFVYANSQTSGNKIGSIKTDQLAIVESALVEGSTLKLELTFKK